MATVRYTYEKIIEILKRTMSVADTAKELGCSRCTVHLAKIKYNKDHLDKLKFKRGGFHRERKQIKSLKDLPPVASKIIKCFSRNPSAKKSEIAELCNTSSVYVNYVINKAYNLRLI